MTKSIDFYFDFISPYSFLAYQKLKNMNENASINIVYKPILLGGLHKLSGITAPAFHDSKLKNMKNDCALIASKNKILFEWNEYFPINSLYLMRGYLFVNEQYKKKFFEVCFDAYWKNNIDISKEKNINRILDECLINKADFLLNIQDQKIKDDLKELTTLAFKKGVFGAPTFVVNNKIFWGQDRLKYALDEYNS
tara:strand:- start:2302 stop:2886 length:585 start_codon:yes stop_codon:yes gene_type:complete